MDDVSKIFDHISLIDSVFGSWEVRNDPALGEYEAQASFFKNLPSTFASFYKVYR